MASLQINSFSSFALTEEEQVSGSVFSADQKRVMQNLISEAAEESLNLTYDGTNPIKYAQQEAYLKGKIDILKWLIEASDAYEAASNAPEPQ